MGNTIVLKPPRFGVLLFAPLLAAFRDAFRGELFGPLFGLMRAGVDQGELQPENPETLTLIFLGIVNNFIGRARELGTDNADLRAAARRLLGAGHLRERQPRMFGDGDGLRGYGEGWFAKHAALEAA